MKNEKNKKRILFVDHDPYNSGSTISMCFLVEKFLKEGFEVYILTPKKTQELYNLSKYNVKTLPFNSKYIVTFKLDLHFTDKATVFSFSGWLTIFKNCIKFILGMKITFRMIKDICPDIVYVNEYVLIQTSIISHFMKIPTVMHIRSRFLSGSFGIRKGLLARAIIKYNDFVLAISEQEKMQLNIKREEENKVKVVHEFLKKQNFQISCDINKLKIKYGLINVKRTVLMLGGILEIKGTLDFLMAAEYILKFRNDVIFVIAGKIFNNSIEEKNYYDKCMEIIELPEIKPYIRLIGHIENPEEIIYCSDIYVSTIKESHFSRPIIEAWALKKAVISYTNPHSIELVKDNENGILIETNKYEELSQAICRLLDAEEYSCKLGLNGFSKVIKEFDTENSLQIIFDKCKNLIDDERKRRN